MKYKILGHTADLRLEVFGKTLEELFQNAAEALAQILYEQSESTKFSAPPKAGQRLVGKVKMHSLNINALLVDFLNEILAKSQINKAVYKVKSLKLKDKSLTAEIEGIKVPRFHEDVKAVTYHEVQINQLLTTNNKQQKLWHTKLVLDI